MDQFFSAVFDSMLAWMSMVVALYGFWVLFLAVMSLYAAYRAKSLSPFTKAMALPCVVSGVLVDFVMNLTLASIIFLEVPQEFLVTQRLERHKKDGVGWRYSLSIFVCRNLLDPFQTGGHCN